MDFFSHEPSEDVEETDISEGPPTLRKNLSVIPGKMLGRRNQGRVPAEVNIREISNMTHWTDPEKTWVSNSFFATYWTGSVDKFPFKFLMDNNTCPIFWGGWGRLGGCKQHRLRAEHEDIYIYNPPVCLGDVWGGTCIANISKPCWILNRNLTNPWRVYR